MLSLPPGDRARAASLPPSGRRSADHGRALRAADKFGLRIAKKLAQRPLMSVWDAIRSDEHHVALTVVDSCATDSERARILGAANALREVGEAIKGLQGVRTVGEPVEAFVSDFFANGTAADLVVLRWPLRERVAFVSRVCEALETVHGAGLVHGALCPENVLLDDELAPILSEIGMVSLADSLEGDREGFFGYGGYASPEAQEGKATDARSDVFSAGRLLAFLVTEHEPDERSEDELSQKATGLATVYRKATSPDPAHRHADVAELRSDLDRVRGDLMATAAPARHTLPGAPLRTATPRKDTVRPAHPPRAPLAAQANRTRPLLLILAVVVLGALAAAAFFLR